MDNKDPFVARGIENGSLDYSDSTQYAGAIAQNTYNPLNNGKNQQDVINTLQSQAYNSAEAQKNRDWQTDLSNTAHQREVADLEAAGLNTWLSAGGDGASTPTGSAGQSSALKATDFMGPSLIHGLTSIAGSIISLFGHKGAGLAVKAAGNFLAKNASSGKQAAKINDVSDSVQRAVAYGERQSKISDAMSMYRKGSKNWKDLQELLGYSGSSFIKSD